MNLRFLLLASGVNQVELEKEVSPGFPFLTPTVLELPLRPTTSEVA